MESTDVPLATTFEDFRNDYRGYRRLVPSFSCRHLDYVAKAT